ncbi:hypothetical protein KR215_010593, partial [Drosophila sulfurigaster]
ECKCTAEKCCDNCKCKLPGKCGCNTSIGATSSSENSCKNSGCVGNKSENGCCKDDK